MIYIRLFLEFFKIGAFTFGGGYAMLPLIEQVVCKNQWMELSDLINFIAVSESTPGPFAVNISTYVGVKVGGIFGAFCATLGVILPSFFIILLISNFYLKWKKNRYIGGCMQGLRPAVVGLIGAALLSVAMKIFHHSEIFCKENIVIAIIFGISFYLSSKKVHPIGIICVSGLLGIIAGFTLRL